jgi:hypothetical protein
MTTNKKTLAGRACWATLLLLSVSPLVSFAYDADFAKRSLADEMAQCATFYMIVAEGPGLDKATSKKMKEAGISLGHLSADMSTEKLALARIDLNTKTMMKEMDNSWDNLAIVLNKYAYLCKEVAEHPDARLKYWLDKKD